MSGRREFMMEKENTFIGKDDLIHCSVCKEPKQAWLPENDLLGVRLRYRQKGMQMRLKRPNKKRKNAEYKSLKTDRIVLMRLQ